jgi:hypothetical protein
MEFLFSHVSRLAEHLPTECDWRRQIYFIEAKGDPGEGGESFRDSLYEVLANTFYEEDAPANSFVFSRDDIAAPHQAWRINFDFPFMRFDPINNISLLREDVYQGAFSNFLLRARDVLGFNQV